MKKIVKGVFYLAVSVAMSGCTGIGSCGTRGMFIEGLNTCSAANPQRLTGKDGTAFACRFETDGRFHFRFDVKDEKVCVAKEVKHPLDIANGDRVEVYFVPDAQMKAGYRCAEIDADGTVLSYSVDEKKNYDWFWKFATLECRARRTPGGYEVSGSVAVDELKSFGINPDDFYLGVFRADMSEPGKVATWCAAAPMLLPAHFHQSAMMIRCTAETPERTAAREAYEQSAEVAVAKPPEFRTAGIAGYSTNRLAFALNNGLAMTKGGRLWASWISGGDGPMSYTVASWSDDGGETWTDVKLVIDGHPGEKPGRTNIIGTFWLDPDGRFHCFTDQSIGHFDGRAGVWDCVCENPDAENPVWSAPRRIAHGHLINKPIVLANGDWAASVYLNDPWKGGGSFPGAFPELDAERGSTCYVSFDRGRTWQRRGTVTFPKRRRWDGTIGSDWQESQLVESRDGGTLRVFARVADGTNGCMMAAESADGGRTWSASHRIPGTSNANARFQIARLRSGRLLFVKHGAPAEDAPAGKGRERLTAYLSDDDGAHWRGGLLLDAGCGSYPDYCEAPDGTIFVSHDHGRGKEGEIWLHRFTEEDVLAGRIVSKRGKLGMLVSRAMATDFNLAR